MQKNESTPAHENLPISTQWTFDAVGEIGRATIPHIFMIVCPTTGSKGSGFLLSNGYIVTNLHVVSGTRVEQIYALSSRGEKINFSNWYFDNTGKLDLILLKPSNNLEGGLNLDLHGKINIGEIVHTWGYPLGYNGPAPQLSVGHLSGFKESNHDGGIFKHFIVNGAFNNGNSGGALFKSGQNKVIGIVVSKHAPISDFHRQAIQALAQNKSGVVFTKTDADGTSTSYAESQIVAEILMAYQNLVQVMIGEAICVDELVNLIRSVTDRLYQEAVKNSDKQKKVSLLQEAKKSIETILPSDELLKKINEGM